LDYEVTFDLAYNYSFWTDPLNTFNHGLREISNKRGETDHKFPNIHKATNVGVTNE